MRDLPRLRPDPTPAIRPVPEHLAAGATRDRYEATKAAMGVPWMGVVAMAFAHYPTFYDTLWRGIAPAVGSRAFHEACRELRGAAEAAAATLSPPDIVARLHGIGYSEAEIADIRACNEVFSHGNMPYLLMATVARLLLEGGDWPTGAAPEPLAPARSHPRPPLMEVHHATPDLADLYADIRATLGLPFVNTDYRAFGRWPSYLATAWPALRAHVTTPTYEARLTEVHATALRLARALPNPTGLDAETLRQAARADASDGEVLAVVRLFQWLLPGLAVNVAFLRTQLGDARSDRG